MLEHELKKTAPTCGLRLSAKEKAWAVMSAREKWRGERGADLGLRLGHRARNWAAETGTAVGAGGRPSWASAEKQASGPNSRNGGENPFPVF